MSTANLDSADLKAASGGGLIREDVMDKIFDISRIPLPFTDLVGAPGKSKQSYIEWTQDTLSAPDTTNAVIDGSDASGNDTVVGVRVGNHHQISDKVVRVSFRADVSNKIGRTKEIAYQMMRRQQELRRDVEAIALTNQASVADNGSNVAGKVGGLPSWLVTSAYHGTNGANGGFNSSTKVTAARTVGHKRALTEALLRDAIQAVYQEGGDVTVMMAVPSVISKFSQYMLSSGGHVAPIQATTSAQSQRPVTALGAVNVFVTDFGTIRAVPNRLQQTYMSTDTTPAAVSDVFLLDTEYVGLSYLQGYQTETLAKTGLAENRQISVDWTLVVNTEKAHGLIADIDGTAAMTA